MRKVILPSNRSLSVRSVMMPILGTTMLAGTGGMAAVMLAGSVSTAAAHDGSGQSVEVEPELEIRPTFDDEAGGYRATDDAAIWIDPNDTEDSLVLASQKEGGLAVYNMDGELQQDIPAPPPPGSNDQPGRINNVDVAYNFPLFGYGWVDIAVVSDRGLDQVRTYVIDPHDPNGPLTDVSAASLPWIFSASQEEVNEEFTAYGLTAWQRFGNTEVFVTQNGEAVVAHLRLLSQADGTVTYEQAGTIELPTQFLLPDGTTWEPCTDPDERPFAEGLVVDDDRGVLYIAQEAVGIWKVRVWPYQGHPRLVDTVGEYGVPWTYEADAEEECVIHYDQDPGYGGKWLTTDVEGLAIYDGGHGRGYLIASSQGSDTFVIYDRGWGNSPIGEFRVVADHGIDGVNGTDGFDVTNVDVGGEFEDGLIVLQDEPNTPDIYDDEGELRDNANLKFVKWGDVAEAFKPELIVNTGPDPRD
ncbi:phytase [Microbulbifer rhizosphaerae]|uniref:3-phytase n=1 Tax=Microbulbifer rhizosphaerae TaxID=1562603 RepID=A0A7W4Z9E3_9GAMM|nr:phytase [Microbulbifer rhizosphaerae]MBB3060149.1 3-phytase [Microbulbifer rhizosphaerae]